MSRATVSPPVFSRCAGCGATYFPERLVCRACGADRFDPIEARDGVVEEGTALRDGTRIVSVRALGVRAVCSSAVDLPPGTTVLLSSEPGARSDGRPVVHLPGSAPDKNKEAS